MIDHRKSTRVEIVNELLTIMSNHFFLIGSTRVEIVNELLTLSGRHRNFKSTRVEIVNELLTKRAFAVALNLRE